MIGKATDVCGISGRSTYILNISQAMFCISILMKKVKHDRPSQQQQQQPTTNNQPQQPTTTNTTTTIAHNHHWKLPLMLLIRMISFDFDRGLLHHHRHRLPATKWLGHHQQPQLLRLPGLPAPRLLSVQGKHYAWCVSSVFWLGESKSAFDFLAVDTYLPLNTVYLT